MTAYTARGRSCDARGCV